MLLGFNTNLKYNEYTYHIQTEDNGLDNPAVISLLYLRGEIIATRKIGSVDMVREADHEEKIKRLMTKRHSSMIEELLGRKVYRIVQTWK